MSARAVTRKHNNGRTKSGVGVNTCHRRGENTQIYNTTSILDRKKILADNF